MSADLRPLGGPSGTPGRVFENLFLTGSNTGGRIRLAAWRLRAFDVITGKLVWTFHTIPHPGEFGYDTWPEGAYKWAGGVNTWGEISIDKSAASRISRSARRRTTCYGGDRQRRQPLRQLACWRSTRAPASGCGTSRRFTTISGTTTSPPRRSC